jgi:retinol dehydrogenase-12
MAVSVEESVENQLSAGTSKGVESGVYYEAVGAVGKQSAYSYDEEVAERFWARTEKELEEWEI